MAMDSMMMSTTMMMIMRGRSNRINSVGNICSRNFYRCHNNHFLLQSHQPHPPLSQRRWSTGTARTGKRQLPKTPQEVTDLIDGNSTDGIPKKKSMLAKLRYRLEKEKVENLSPAAQGQLDTFGEDIADVLNEALEDKVFMDDFKGATRLDQVLEIVEVEVNQDVSHVTAYWSSPVLNGFVQLIRKSAPVASPKPKRSWKPKKLTSTESTTSPSSSSSSSSSSSLSAAAAAAAAAASTTTTTSSSSSEAGAAPSSSAKGTVSTTQPRQLTPEEDAHRIWKRGVAFINEKLRLREPQFRSYLMKHLTFRKVPRVFFVVYDPKTSQSRSMLEELLEQQAEVEQDKRAEDEAKKAMGQAWDSEESLQTTTSGEAQEDDDGDRKGARRPKVL